MSGAEFRAYKVALAACALAWTLLLAFLAGPLIVANVLPVRTEMRVDRIARTAERLCWDSSGIKVREGSTDDLDVFLYAGGIAGRMVVGVYGEADGTRGVASARRRSGRSTSATVWTSGASRPRRLCGWR